MKTFVKALLLVMLFAVVTNAQSAFNKGDKIGQLGIGFGLTGVYGDASFPPLTAGFQYGIEKQLSVGGFFGYASSGEEWGSYEWDYTYVIFGARGEYHFTELFENNKDIDAYAGISLGYAVVSSSFDGPDVDEWWWGGYDEGESYMLFGFHAGMRYYVSPKFAVFGELGYGIGIITVGAAYKF